MAKKVKTVFETNIPGLTLATRGKVRDIYDLGDQALIVATDRLSAFDSVLATPIPLKGIILTKMAEFWFDFTKDIIKSHYITTDVSKMGHGLEEHADTLDGRAMLVRKAEVMPVECVVRGYLAGSGWKEYQEKGSVCGVALPKGLKNGSQLPEPLFTPATKAERGHDENITYEKAVEIVGQDRAEKMKGGALAIYTKAREYALERGIIIADTKFEFGVIDDEVILIDEVLTPDSSRFWPKDSYTPGQTQLAFDKQFVRDYLETLGWDKKPPGPALPDKVAQKTTEKYLDAYGRLTGKELEFEPE
ncbi:MAG: phosphoribosylaminoimidazolesuccinocarboxamide synthase [Planctomycetota bacterium]|jgi:phosphoribosylaminoimidazole-succinocarboxamide synthase